MLNASFLWSIKYPRVADCSDEAEMTNEAQMQNDQEMVISIFRHLIIRH
jgi:hypothetical protein